MAQGKKKKEKKSVSSIRFKDGNMPIDLSGAQK